MEVAGNTSELEVRSQMVTSMRSVSIVSSKLLVTAKSVSADPHAPNAKNQLSSAARAVTDSINGLLDVCTKSAPGQKECDSAIRNIEVNAASSFSIYPKNLPSVDLRIEELFLIPIFSIGFVPITNRALYVQLSKLFSKQDNHC